LVLDNCFSLAETLTLTDREEAAMSRIFAVMRSYGPPYDRGQPLEQQRDWEAHRAFMNDLQAKGSVSLGGPLEEREDVLLIFRAEFREDVERILAGDPWTRSGILRTTRISGWDVRIGETP
jgi:uncharacterized protein YciI